MPEEEDPRQYLLVTQNRRTYRNEAVVVDGNRFIECTFVECHMIYSGRDYIIEGEQTFDRCTWEFQGPAARTVEWLKRLEALNAGFYQLTHGH